VAPLGGSTSIRKSECLPGFRGADRGHSHGCGQKEKSATEERPGRANSMVRLD